MPEQQLAVASRDKDVRIFDAKGNYQRALVGHTSWVFAVTHVGGGKLVTGSRDKTVRVWEESGLCEQVLQGHKGAIKAVLGIPKGR